MSDPRWPIFEDAMQTLEERERALAEEGITRPYWYETAEAWQRLKDYDEELRQMIEAGK